MWNRADHKRGWNAGHGSVKITNVYEGSCVFAQIKPAIEMKLNKWRIAGHSTFASTIGCMNFNLSQCSNMVNAMCRHWTKSVVNDDAWREQTINLKYDFLCKLMYAVERGDAMKRNARFLDTLSVHHPEVSLSVMYLNGVSINRKTERSQWGTQSRSSTAKNVMNEILIQKFVYDLVVTTSLLKGFCSYFATPLTLMFTRSAHKNTPIHVKDLRFPSFHTLHCPFSWS